MKLKIKALLVMALSSVFMACGQQNEQSDYATVDANEFTESVKNDPTAYILDVRTPQEYAEEHIAGAHNLDWLNKSEFERKAKDLPKGSTLYVYCRSGKRSAQAASYLSRHGYKVVNLRSGILSLPTPH